MTKVFVPNYTPIPNVVVDDLMLDLSDAAFKIYVLLIRKTKGWDKTRDAISLTQFVRLSGKSRPTVIKCLEELISLGLIKKNGETVFGNEYELNLSFSIDGILLKFPTSKNSLLVKSFYHPSKNSLLLLVKNFYPQNKLSKQTIKTNAQSVKKPAHEDENLLLKNFDLFWSAYPNKKDKKRAEQKFMKINFKKIPFEKLMGCLEAQKKTFDWTKNNGQFVPMASTWINGERWNDQIAEPITGHTEQQSQFNGSEIDLGSYKSSRPNYLDM